jgi:hypothetical protein
MKRKSRASHDLLALQHALADEHGVVQLAVLMRSM